MDKIEFCDITRLKKDVPIKDIQELMSIKIYRGKEVAAMIELNESFFTKAAGLETERKTQFKCNVCGEIFELPIVTRCKSCGSWNVRVVSIERSGE